MPTPSNEIWHRDDFPLICIARKLAICVEVGVSIGQYSDMFMQRHWNLGLYIGIDPFEPYWEFPYCRDSDKQMALSVFCKHIGKCYLAISDGCTIADSIRNREFGPIKGGTVDFVYIDALHEYDSVKQDMNAWWDLISENGVMSGHDYDQTHPGVMQAVDEFEKEKGVTVYYTPDHPNSWYIYKNGKTTFNHPRF